jgi:hypothetical protein
LLGEKNIAQIVLAFFLQKLSPAGKIELKLVTLVSMKTVDTLHKVSTLFAFQLKNFLSLSLYPSTTLLIHT